MTDAEATIRVLQNKISDILQTTDWNPKESNPRVIIKMIEVKSSFV